MLLLFVPFVKKQFISSHDPLFHKNLAKKRGLALCQQNLTVQPIDKGENKEKQLMDKTFGNTLLNKIWASNIHLVHTDLQKHVNTHKATTVGKQPFTFVFCLFPISYSCSALHTHTRRIVLFSPVEQNLLLLWDTVKLPQSCFSSVTKPHKPTRSCLLLTCSNTTQHAYI